jgi:hypothetical protein
MTQSENAGRHHVIIKAITYLRISRLIHIVSVNSLAKPRFMCVVQNLSHYSYLIGNIHTPAVRNRRTNYIDMFGYAECWDITVLLKSILLIYLQSDTWKLLVSNIHSLESDNDKSGLIRIDYETKL